MLEQNAIRQLRTIAEEQKAQTPLPVLAQLGQYIALGLDGRVAEDVAVEIQSAETSFGAIRQLDANARAFLTGVLPQNQMPAALSAQISDDPDRWVGITCSTMSQMVDRPRIEHAMHRSHSAAHGRSG